MSSTSARSSHLSQPVVKSVLVYRNGDPFFAGRRVVIHEKRVSSFDVFLKEVTGGVQAPFGAVRNIYTPRTGHRIRKLDQIQSGGNYVAGGQEAFKKLNYLDIGEIKKRPMEVMNTEVKPVIHSRINVSARFRKPLLEPCTIFLIANGDLINPASRLLIPRKALSQWDHVLQMVTEKITLRSGAVHRLYTLEGKLVESGSELENGQFYVAVGRDKFKKLPYGELLFDKSTMRRSYGKGQAAAKDQHSCSLVTYSSHTAVAPRSCAGPVTGATELNLIFVLRSSLCRCKVFISGGTWESEIKGLYQIVIMQRAHQPTVGVCVHTYVDQCPERSSWLVPSIVRWLFPRNL
ncbi:doublecortin domain-containing protein 2 [Camelus ferus]|nr:doublecortin domain-containing protein 2 [Camelus ferus]